MHASRPQSVPFSRGWRHYVGRFLLWLTGWKVEGQPPSEPRWVSVAAPHTSNWDLFYMMATAFWWEMDINWLGKHTIFKGPQGWFFRKLGGIPVDRRQRGNMVENLAKHIRDSERIILAIPPAGTRSRREYWKSGFYFVAKAAGVPVGLGFLDFARKRSGFGPTLYLTGDLKTDMNHIRGFYSKIQGKLPAQHSRILLRQEEELEDVTPRPVAAPAAAPPPP